MRIRSKHESDLMLRKLNLNRMEDYIFTKNQIPQAIDWVKSTNYRYYNIRDKANYDGEFLFKLTADEVIAKMNNYDKFAIYKSMYEEDSHLILQGYIYVNPNQEFIATLDIRKSVTLRYAMKDAKYHIDTINDYRHYPKVTGLSKVLEYIATHHLFNVIVEFSMYDILVGTNKENILIWELRDY